MNKNYLFFSLLFFCFIGCTNWQEEYKKKVAEVTEPVKDKIVFFNEKYSELSKYAESICYNNTETVPILKLIEIAESIPEKDNKEYNSDSYIVLNVPDSCGDHLYDHIFFNFDDNSCGLEKSYWYYLNDTLLIETMTEDNMNYYLEKIKSEIIEPLQKAKYLLVIKDKVLIKPYCPLYGDGFESGYVLSEVQVYDFSNKQLIDTFDVAAQNSNNVKVETDLSYSIDSNGEVDIKGTGFTKNGNWTLIKNIYSNLKKNAILQAERRRNL